MIMITLIFTSAESTGKAYATPRKSSYTIHQLGIGHHTGLRYKSRLTIIESFDIDVIYQNYACTECNMRKNHTNTSTNTPLSFPQQAL